MKNSLFHLGILSLIFLFIYSILFLAQGFNAFTPNAVPLYYAALYVFGLQVMIFLPSYYFQTEHYFDLTGGLTYISLFIGMLAARVHVLAQLDVRSLLLSTMIVCWAFRLSRFLFIRVKRRGKDGRFDELKKSFTRFLLTWTLQGVWVFICALPALIVLTQPSKPMGLLGFLGLVLWLIGFVIEVQADAQKRSFQQQKENEGKFIQEGWWARSRHPNYFGEFLLWCGITLTAVPLFEGSLWVGCITPLFVYLLLNKVSGVNLLESRADEKWKNNAAYQAYKKKTPVFFPKIMYI